MIVRSSRSSVDLKFDPNDNMTLAKLAVSSLNVFYQIIIEPLQVYDRFS